MVRCMALLLAMARAGRGVQLSKFSRERGWSLRSAYRDIDTLSAAGVPVEQLQARGHFHSSYTMVDVVITGVAGRIQMAQALRRFAGLPPEVKVPPQKLEAAAS